MINNKDINNATQAHRNSILKTLEHRLKVARANGKTALVDQLEAEKRYYLG